VGVAHAHRTVNAFVFPYAMEEVQRDIKASISSCIRCLSSSDHAEPGFWLSLLCGRGGGAVLISRGDFRGAILSFRVGRDEGLEGFD